nr:MAG TPA: hypothetical protein [Caudoviricetes sp.]
MNGLNTDLNSGQAVFVFWRLLRLVKMGVSRGWVCSWVCVWVCMEKRNVQRGCAFGYSLLTWKTSD